MKTIRTTTKTLMGAKNSSPHPPRFENAHVPILPEAAKQSRIQWPSEKQIMDVSKKLAKINRMGIRAEANGDYFNSGDLAYQLQEIIRATAGLFERGRRLQRKTNEE